MTHGLKFFKISEISLKFYRGINFFQYFCFLFSFSYFLPFPLYVTFYLHFLLDENLKKIVFIKAVEAKLLCKTTRSK